MSTGPAGESKEKLGWRRDWIVDLLSLRPDATYQETGQIVGCTKQRVQQVVREVGLSHKSRLYRRDVDIERVLNLYYHSNLLVNEMAQILGCHANTITNRLRAAGISPRESYSRRQKLYWRRVSSVASCIIFEAVDLVAGEAG